MKLCIIIRGPIRPNKEVVLKNIILLKNDFAKFDFDILFSTWNENMKDVSYIINVIKPSFFLIENVPSISFNFKEHSFNPKNCFLQFYLANKAIDFALKKKKYDFIVMTRTDLNISIDTYIWIKQDCYTTIHSKQCGQPFTNDQFGISDPNIMKMFWSYENNNQLLIDIDQCSFPEQIIDNNIDKFKIKVIQQPTKLWEIKR